MELIIDHENAAINAIITERTAAHWQDAPEFSALLEPAYYLDDPPVVPGLQYLLKLVGLICQSDEEQSNRVFLLLESHCAVAEPAMVAQVLARFIMEGAEPYPNLPPAPSGWLAWVPDYKPELLRKGEMVKRLWRLAKTRGEDIEQMAIQWIVSSMARRQDSEQHTAKWRKQAIDPSDASQDQVRTRNYTSQSVIYLLCCGPLSDQEVVLWHQESLLNTLVRIRDGRDPRALENQQLILVNLLDRFFLWMDHKEEDEDIEQLKFRIISHTKTPELLQFAMDAILRYQDGRWVRSDFKDEGVRTRAAGLSLMETNRDREPIHYRSSDQSGGPFGFSESKNAIRGKPLKEREVPRKLGRLTSVQTFEVGDLVAQCMDGHEADTMEQLLRSLILHIGMRVDTAMVSASSAVLKHAAQQRDKILLRLVAENPVYRRIMISAMEQGS
ncbi:hypothetical protein EDD11_007182 [Mortierella claussenii]|nr:hypothetical protein EDD11_007182 [Mortierella claussenii]